MWIESVVSLWMAIGYVTTALLSQPLESISMVTWNRMKFTEKLGPCLMTMLAFFSGLWFILHAIYLSLNFAYVRTETILSD